MRGPSSGHEPPTSRLGFFHPREWKQVDRPTGPGVPREYGVAWWRVFWTTLALVVIGSVAYLAILNR